MIDSETIPTFYQHAIKTLERLKQIKSDIDITKIKTKQTYENLITTEKSTPDANGLFLILILNLLMSINITLPILFTRI